jgi:hypothetical protein
MTESQNKALHDEWLQVAISYKLDWEEELARRAALGITGPEPLPHPDHVIVDLRHGTVDIRGPMTKEEKAKYDMLLERKQEFEEELAAIQNDLATETDDGIRRILLDELEYDQKILNIISRALQANV